MPIPVRVMAVVISMVAIGQIGRDLPIAIRRVRMARNTVSVANVTAKKIVYSYSKNRKDYTAKYQIMFDDQTTEEVSRRSFDSLRMGARAEIHRIP